MDEKELKIHEKISEIGGKGFRGGISKVGATKSGVIIETDDIEALLKIIVPVVHKRGILAVVSKKTPEED